MSIRMHHFLRILLLFVVYLLGLIAFFSLFDRLWLGMAFLFLAFLFAPRAAHWFSELIPAACPGCGGPAFSMTTPEGRLVFRCSECGHVEETVFSEGMED